MPPTTRSSAARIAGFPGIPHQEHAPRKTRSVPESVKGPQSAIEDSCIPPTYTIDLSLPPSQRYVQAASDFKEQILALTGLFGEVVAMIGLPLGLAIWLARVFLRRLHSSEQTEELRGISRATGVDMYLVVAFNTLLDLFMGCTSGGIKVKDGNGTKMMHFRTLDWGMDVLRKVTVQFDFVEKPGGAVVARTITYVGFVGVLTGVRPNLSVSLNFRPYHNDYPSKITNFKFYTHLLLVLLGLRPSISAILRDFIIPARRPSRRALIASQKAIDSTQARNRSMLSLADITRSLPSVPTTASYLIFSDGDAATVFEKDRIIAQVYMSSSFIVATNHDVDDERSSRHSQIYTKQHFAIGMEDLVAESQDRKGCMVSNWQKLVRKQKRKVPGSGEDDVAVGVAKLKQWVSQYPITNEETHYAAIMDPKEGKFVWVRKYDEPIQG